MRSQTSFANSGCLIIQQRKSGTADAKPFTNFGVFHDSIMSRLKGLGAVQSGFDTKIKEVETRLEKQYKFVLSFT